MILPIRTSIRPWRTPYVNYTLIIANALVFFLQFQVDPATGGVGFRPMVDKLMLNPSDWHSWQFVTYAFLHGGMMHIIGNMFFLYLFGNNVNDKLGHLGYLCFYLAGAIFSGLGHFWLSNNPVLGASGAVAAVTGAYLVLFPQSLVTVMYWLLFFIGTMEVPALYFIAFKMIFLDNIIARSTPNVAYDAHLAGYAFGIVAVLIMRATGLVPSSTADLWSMLRLWNRRRHYRDVVSDDYDPYTGQKAKKAKTKEVKKTSDQKQDEEKAAVLREQIDRHIAGRNLAGAAQEYLELMKIDSSQLPSRQSLLDIANQLASENKSAESAHAYEQFLTHYSKYEYTEQVQLMVGILYSRYLDKPNLAIKHLSAAAKKLSDQGQLKMCNDELAKLKRQS